MLHRIQKIMASAGIASRRKCEELIIQGRVRVNGSAAVIGESADTDKDIIEVDGKRIAFEKKVYIALYKPRGYVTTVSDRFAKMKVTDLVRIKERVYPVGRLDADSEGLLLMTNDGDFANKVMHPRYNIEKAYVVRLEKPLSEDGIRRLEKGILIDGVKTWPAKVRLLGSRVDAEIIIHEGRHKIVKRMFRELGNYVLSLTRTRIGGIYLKGIPKGSYRHLDWKEVKSFFQNETKEKLH